MSKLPVADTASINHPSPEAYNQKYLYKYYSFNKEHPEYLDDLFLKNRLYHSLPKHLNDPFEAKPKFRIPNGAKENEFCRKYIKKVLKKNNIEKLSIRKIDQIVSEVMANPMKKVEVIYSGLLSTYNTTRVCCFTTTNDNLLMWSHYANAHTGFCVGFNAENSPFNATCKVSYEDDKYPIAKFPLKVASIFDPLLNKANCWEYEQEYRSILVASAPYQKLHNGESFYLDEGDMIDIYLGIAINESDKNRLQALIKKSIFSPRIWQAATNFDSYSIDFIPVDVD